jgi:hypothetical protein
MNASFVRITMILELSAKAVLHMYNGEIENTLKKNVEPKSVVLQKGGTYINQIDVVFENSFIITTIDMDGSLSTPTIFIAHSSLSINLESRLKLSSTLTIRPPMWFPSS